MTALPVEAPSEPVLQLSIQIAVLSRHISSASGAHPNALEAAQPGSATPRQGPVVPDRKCGTNSACTPNKPLGHVRFLQATEGTECAVSSKGAWPLSSCPNCQCS